MAELSPEQRKAIAIARARAKLDKEMSFDGSHPVEQEADARQKVGDALMVGFPQGFLMGGADEALAGVTAAYDYATGPQRIGRSLPELYGRRLEDIRHRIEQVEERSPDAVQAGKMMGGAATGAVPVLGALKVTQGAPLAVRALAGGSAGAAAALTEGFLEGEGGAAPRFENAMQLGPIAWGGGLGAAAPVLGKGVGEVLGRVMARKNPEVRGLGYDKIASAQIARAFDRDANFTRDPRLYIAGLGKEGTLADLGVNTRQTARGLAGMPGEGGQIAALSSVDRQRGRLARVLEDMDDSLGTRVDVAYRRDELIGMRREAAKSAYGAFYAQNFDMDNRLRSVFQRAHELGALGDLKKIAKARGWDLYGIRNNHAVTVSGEFLDEASRALRDASGAAFRSGKGNLGQSLAELNDELLNASPGLRDVRRRYASDSDLIHASESGAEILKSSEPHAAFKRRWKNMPPEAQNEFRMSARDALANAIEGAVNDANKSLSMFAPTNSLAKIRTVFGADAMRKIERRVSAERAMAETDNRVRAGSDTAATRQFQQDMGPLLNDAGRRAGPWRRTRQSVGDAGNAVVDAFLARSADTTTRDMARMLTAQGADRNRLLAALMSDSQRSGRNRRLTNRIDRRLTQALAAASGGLSLPE